MRIRTNGWCKYYRGLHKDKCAAGVVYAEQFPTQGTRGFHDVCPCFGETSKTLDCEKAEYPTEKEREEAKKLLDKRLADMGRARSAIVDAAGGPWKKGKPAVSGKIDCPVCSGKKTLQYSRAGVNGHIHARCSTEGCVAWME